MPWRPTFYYQTYVCTQVAYYTSSMHFEALFNENLEFQIRQMVLSHYGNMRPSRAGIDEEIQNIKAKFSLDDESAKRYLHNALHNLGW